MNKENQKIYKTIYDAYIYAVPLVFMDLMEESNTNTLLPTDKKAPIGQLTHAKTLASPNSKGFPYPNSDTVYSNCYFELKDEPYVFHKPATDRYCSIQLIDAYANNIQILGTGGLDNSKQATYVFTSPDFKGDTPIELERIDVPTNKIWILIRTIVYNEEDLKNVYEIQDKMKVFPLSAYKKEYTPKEGVYKKENDFVPLDKIRSLDVSEFFNRFNRLAINNPGRSEDKKALDKFKEVNVGAGLKFDINNFAVEVKDALKDLPKKAEYDVREANKVYKLINNWIYMNPEIALPSTDYVLRAAVAYGGTANPVSMAMYLTCLSDKEGKLLNGKNKYKLHFEKDKLPLVHKNGFWSITAYSNGYLINNKIDRYIINDRSEFKYNDDGSLDIFIEKYEKDFKHMNNLLPVTDADFVLIMRIYIPKEEVINYKWQPPAIEKY